MDILIIIILTVQDFTILILTISTGHAWLYCGTSNSIYNLSCWIMNKHCFLWLTIAISKDGHFKFHIVEKHKHHKRSKWRFSFSVKYQPRCWPSGLRTILDLEWLISYFEPIVIATQVHFGVHSYLQALAYTTRL